MKINPINSNNIMPVSTNNKKHITFKSGIEQDTFEKQLMQRINVC